MTTRFDRAHPSTDWRAWKRAAYGRSGVRVQAGKRPSWRPRQAVAAGGAPPDGYVKE